MKISRHVLVAAAVLASVLVPPDGSATPSAAAQSPRSDDRSLEELERELEKAEREARRLRAEVWAQRAERAMAPRIGRGPKPEPSAFDAPVVAGQGLGLTLIEPGTRLGLTVRLGISDDPDPRELRGALVEGVADDGPADRAGLAAGDLVTHWNGELLVPDPPSSARRSPGARRLGELVRGLDSGDEVELTYERDGEVSTVTITSRELSSPWLLSRLETRALAPAPEQGPLLLRPWVRLRFSGPFADLEAVEIGPEIGDYFGTDGGLLVLQPPSDGLFELRPGDVILSIGDRRPDDPAHAMEILDSYRGGETIRLHVQRRREALVLEAEAPDHWGLAGAVAPRPTLVPESVLPRGRSGPRSDADAVLAPLRVRRLE